jgi:S-adenosylmethionine hydrolase
MLFDNPDLNQVLAIENGGEAYAIEMFRNGSLSDLKAAGPIQISYNKQLNVQQDMIISEVLFSDRHGNCYFNLTKPVFEEFVRNKNYSFRIQHYTGQIFSHISESVNDVNPGDALITFSRTGHLKLLINLGSAKQLFRIKDDTKIILETA